MIELILAIPIFLLVVFLIVLCFVKGAGVTIQIVNDVFAIGKDLLKKAHKALRAKLHLENNAT